MARNPETISLAGLSNLPAEYAHEWRVAAPQEPLVLPGTIFKWYHVHRDGESVPDAMDAEARAVIAEAVAVGLWQPEYGLNFALIHLSTLQAFLIAGVWRGHQEMWLRHYFKDLPSAGPFTRIDPSGENVPGACVWELGVVCHERMAWHRYLFTERTEADMRAWLADTYQGQV